MSDCRTDSPAKNNPQICSSFQNVRRRRHLVEAFEYIDGTLPSPCDTEGKYSIPDVCPRDANYRILSPSVKRCCPHLFRSIQLSWQSIFKTRTTLLLRLIKINQIIEISSQLESLILFSHQRLDPPTREGIQGNQGRWVGHHPLEMLIESPLPKHIRQ